MSVTFDNANLALQTLAPGNELIYDDVGLPSVMVKIPKFKMSEVITGGSDSTHPAFIVDGVEKDAIWISKYQNIVTGSRAYSLPARDPKANIMADQAIAACSAKGAGWHLMTAAEWGAIVLWCKKNGFLPWGNNDYGKDTRESVYRADPSMPRDSSNRRQRVATGTGPLTWSHDKSPAGIWDLNGNVWEWNGGLRLVYGELQILANNDAANSEHSQAASSTLWKAIDGTTGDLITPNGSGTTANSLKLDYVSSKWKWITGTLSSKADQSRNCTFINITADSAVCAAAKSLLYALALLPDDSSFDYEGDVLYANNGVEERFPSRGGRWYDGTSAGVFGTGLHYARSDSAIVIGFRSAFYE